MSASSLATTLLWVIIAIVVIILIFIIAERLISHLVIAPMAYGQEQGEDIVVNKTVTTDNDTTITITCTENMKGLVESCG